MNIHFSAEYADGETVRISVPEGLTYSQALFLEGLMPGRTLCAGLGRCGQCRARFAVGAPLPRTQEIRLFTPEEIENGHRLTCLHAVAEGARLAFDTPLPKSEKQPEEATEKAVSGKEAACILAIDLGTTSIHWQARMSGETIAAGQELNPQMGAGSEVMSRMAFAEKGYGPRLRELVVERFREIARSLPCRPEAMSVAGNTVMTSLLLGKPLTGLARAPYRLDLTGDSFEHPGPGLPPCYIPPMLAPFVGGDISAGLAAVCLSPQTPPEYPFLLADMGTNGEFALALSEREIIVASVPMGPALEGVGLRFGTLAAPGAIVAFRLSPQGLLPVYFDNRPKTPPAGITGTGYLSLLALLRSLKILDERGAFGQGSLPLALRLSRQLKEASGEPRLPLPGGLHLSASDVEEFLKVKAAFNLAMAKLLGEANLRPGDLKKVYLAGAMGLHAPVDAMTELGFLPAMLQNRVVAAGNTSLAGAALLASDQRARDWIKKLTERTRLVELAGDASFGEDFINRMRFEYVG